MLKRHYKLILPTIYLIAVALSLLLSTLKHESLGFQQRDYPFYLQFSAKLLDKDLTKVYSINPNGENWLHYFGTEGETGFYQSIHLEPVKYLFAVLYSIADSPYVLFAFIALVFYSPLLYLLASSKDHEQEMPLCILIALLYVAFPSSAFASSNDLRPYILLAPVFFLTLISITYRRPAWETLIFFNALFLIREEALILGGVLLVYAFLRNGQLQEFRRIFPAMIAILVFWGAVAWLYFNWTGYPRDAIYIGDMLPVFKEVRSFQSLLSLPLFWGIAGTLVTGVFILYAIRRKEFFKPLLAVLAYGALIVPFLYFFYTTEQKEMQSPSLQWLLGILFNPYYFFYFVYLLGFVFVVPPFFSRTIHKMSMGIAVVLFFLFAMVNVLSNRGLVSVLRTNREHARQAEMIWEIKQQTDKYQTQVLTDYATLQAFYDYENVYCFERLPAYMLSGDDRFYPYNTRTLQELLADNVEYIVISKKSLPDVQDLMLASGVDSVTVLQNKEFIVLQIEK